MKPIPNAGRVLTRSLVMWCVYLAGVLEVLPDIIPIFADVIPRWLSLAFLLAAPLARIIPQTSLYGEKHDHEA